MGTPKTLQQAIQNGLHEANEVNEYCVEYYLTIDQIVELHVRDFLAQKFAINFLTDDDAIRDLWNRITEKKVA